MPSGVSALSLLSSIHLLQSLSSQGSLLTSFSCLKCFYSYPPPIQTINTNSSREAQKGLHHLSPPTCLSSWSPRPPFPHTSRSRHSGHPLQRGQTGSVSCANSKQLAVTHKHYHCELEILISAQQKCGEWLQRLLLVWGRGCHTSAIPECMSYCSLTVLPRF